jgi:hypothetical protein
MEGIKETQPETVTVAPGRECPPIFRHKDEPMNKLDVLDAKIEETIDGMQGSLREAYNLARELEPLYEAEGQIDETMHAALLGRIITHLPSLPTTLVTVILHIVGIFKDLQNDEPKGRVGKLPRSFEPDYWHLCAPKTGRRPCGGSSLFPEPDSLLIHTLTLLQSVVAEFAKTYIHFRLVDAHMAARRRELIGFCGGAVEQH